MTQATALEEGIFAGVVVFSSGSIKKIAEEIDLVSSLHHICDRGDRYLSSDLFD
jgi:cysteine synthase B